ncbi:MAG TPA: hypothetical protein VFH29_02255, partial [Anaerolineales bacterium]|nr:hypothetical protein [Anaerolineales bacterium]
LALLVARAVSGNISHDENQFIAPGQFLAYNGLLPYVDYPYTHMPYAIPFYALSALLSDYDLLAGRLLSALFWFGCIVSMVAIGRRLTPSQTGANDGPSWGRLIWEFALVLALIQDATAQFVLHAALNHSLATFFSLISVLFFVLGVQEADRWRAAPFWSGVFVAMAGLTRFNYASLVVVLLAGWLIHGIQREPRAWKPCLLRYGEGVLLASLPALVLVLLAPRQFYYGNIVYIRLNTVYYEALLHRTGMDMASKLGGFASIVVAEPMEALLYAVLLVTVIAALMRARQRREKPDIVRLTIAAVAFTLWMTAFAPTPLLLQYLFAPLPFLLILLMAAEIRLPRFGPAARTVGALAVAAAVILGVVRRNPLPDFGVLARPNKWPPMRVHELAVTIRQLVPQGRVLALQSMVPLEAGLNAYPFTATGPFSWRTSLLLTPARRAEYKVTSPDELAALLQATPPDAVLVGFEEQNSGFERKDMGGLETPFSEFAASNGYTPQHLDAGFGSRGLTLWIRP